MVWRWWLSKEYYCEDHDVWVSEDLVEVELIREGASYIHFNLPDEPCQLYYQTEIREIE
jgi:hypothetical protein